jgi:hypothetical protein
MMGLATIESPIGDDRGASVAVDSAVQSPSPSKTSLTNASKATTMTKVKRYLFFVSFIKNIPFEGAKIQILFVTLQAN